jgi:TetR/AcrR family transcriptional regulator, cholesterol catabolism regulator
VTQPATSRDDSAQVPPSRTESKRAGRVERIERAAARVFATRGYDGANFADIAAELDLRGPSLYHYFSSKDELFLRCLEHSADRVFVRLRAIATAHHADPLERLHALVREQVLIEVQDFPEFVPLFFKMRLPAPELTSRVLDLRRQHAAVFEQAAADVRIDRGLDAGDVRVWLGVDFGALAYLQDWYDPSGALDPEQLAERMAATLLEPFRRGGTLAGSNRPNS